MWYYTKFCIDLRLDVFSKEKGSGKLYENDDFNSDYFGEDWWFVMDKHGDGCCI